MPLSIHRLVWPILAVAWMSAIASAAEPDPERGIRRAGPCEDLTFRGQGYAVCRFDAAKDQIRIFHSRADGTPYLTFDALAADLASSGATLLFAMNAGMYHVDRTPVGLLVTDGSIRKRLNKAVSFGNFYLKPNGVFFIGKDRAGVMETRAYDATGIRPVFATQSGPMLVIDGKLHPRFLADATSRNIRNGVGVARDGRSVVFAISDGQVTFHEFGSLFREALDTPNALYFDGSISRLYATDLGRNDSGAGMGPIVAVTAGTLVPAHTRKDQSP